MLKFLAVLLTLAFSQPAHNTKAAGIQAAPGVDNPNYPRRASDLRR